MSMSRITDKKNIWKYYVKLPNFKAQCMFCKNKYTYVSVTNFQMHIVKYHRDIWKYEKERKLMKRPWRYFKYFDKLHSQCIICDASVSSATESIKKHLNSHSTQLRAKYIRRGWCWKYWTKRDDFMVECNVCNNNVSLFFSSIVKYHIKDNHLNTLKRSMRETYDIIDTSERVSLLETDTSMSSNIVIKKYLWKYYVKLPRFEAQCRYCENKYNYIKVKTFRKHIRLHHKKIWKYEEEKKLAEYPWIYFKYLNILQLQCIICDAKVWSTSTSVETHLSLHSEEQQRNHALRSWPWKYCAQKDDFAVECKICHNNISLSIRNHLDSHIKMTHSDKLKIMQETHDAAGSLKRSSSVETDTSMSSSIITKKYLWEYFAKLPDFKAQCTFCKMKYSYINISNFQKHIQIRHDKIWKYEEKRKLIKWPWTHFKYLDKIYSQCLICGASVPSKIESVENHWNDSHSEEQQKNRALRSWPWKYCTQKDDFMVKCNLCCNNFSLSLHHRLYAHIKMKHLDKLESMQAHDTVGSLKRIASFQADKTFVSPKIATKQHLWKYYVKLPNFKAQCMFCKNKYSYASINHFQRHMQIHHDTIWKYEAEKKLIKWPWMHFKYLDNIYSQCIICDEKVPSTSKCVETHLSSHSKKQQKNHTPCSWQWKYCAQKDDFAVECEICHKKLSLTIQHYLDSHIKMIHSDKLKITQETHDTADSSKHSLSLGTDAASKLLALKDCYVLLTRYPPYKLYI